MLRAVAAACRSLRLLRLPYLLTPLALRTSLPHISLSRTVSLACKPVPDRPALVDLFRRAPFVGPITANQLVNAGCHSHADALAPCGKPGRVVRLNHRQHVHMSQAQ